MIDWLLLKEGIIVYLALFFALIGGAVGLPIPEDVPLILAGILAHTGQADLQLLFFCCYSGIILGDLIIFSLGRRFGPTLLRKKWIRTKIPIGKISEVRVKLEKRSLLMIFLARHLFYLRTVTFLTCGAVKMKWSRFIIADALAALISAPLMIGIGYLASERYEAALKFFGRARTFTLIALIAVVICVLLYFTFRRRRGLEQQ